MYTAVDPGTYASTSDSANYIMNSIGVENKKTEEGQRRFAGVVPAAIGSDGGFHAVQLYERKSDRIGYGYDVKERKAQHVNAAKAMPDIWNEYLFEDWNTIK